MVINTKDDICACGGKIKFDKAIRALRCQKCNKEKMNVYNQKTKANEQSSKKAN